MGQNMKKMSKRDKEHIGENILNEIWIIGTTIYVFIVFLFSPLYVKDHYYDMALNKWKIYFYSTLCFLGFAILVILFQKLYEKNKKVQRHKSELTWFCMIAYAGAVLLSFITCPNKFAALLGTDGWYMGALAQLLMVLTYFVFSIKQIPLGAVLIFHAIASAFTNFYGICQSLGWDWLHLYYNMPAEIIRDYLSTIGNRTWFSGYMCTAFPIGLYFFWSTQNKYIKKVSGAYVLLMFAALVSTGSDSLYAALAVVLSVLGILSIGHIEKYKGIVDIGILWFISNGMICLLREISEGILRDIRGLSKVFMRTEVIAIGLLFLLLVRWVISRKEELLKKEYNNVIKPEQIKKYQVRVLLVLLIAGLLLILLVICNSTGILQQFFGITIENKYLYFDDKWGDGRGHTWKLTLQMFMELPIVQKLFGVGADCYSYYAYTNPEYSAILQARWGEAVMANAHNEWLNSLFCFGIVGGCIYLGSFLTMVYECFVKVDLDKVHPLVPATGLTVLAYIAHNFFCYQQVSATTYIFILMGIATNLIKCRDY